MENASSYEDLPGLDALDSGCAEGCVGVGHGIWEIDGTSGIFDDQALKSEGGAVEGGVADAEVVSEAAEEEALESPLAEIAGEAGGGEVVVFEKGGASVDGLAEALA